jgi:isopentenyldiphosphate isomerase
MTDELVDVVNEKDMVIGKEWKNKCHKEGIWHRVVGVLLFNSDGKMWLQKRAKHKTFQGRNLDFSASGHMGSGDTYEEAAKRELFEELGVSVELKDSGIKILEDYIYSEGVHVRHIIKLFIGKHDGPFEVQEEELEGIKSYSINEVKEILKKKPPVMTEGLKLVLEEYFRQNENR